VLGKERIVEQEVFAAPSITGTAVGRVAKRSGSATAAGRAGAPPVKKGWPLACRAP